MNSVNTQMRRRGFIRVLAVATGLAIAGGGFAWWGTRRPAISLTQNQCAGNDAMSNKVLVVYASRAGSTGEIAEAVAKQLCQAGLAVDVRPVAGVTGIDGYAAVVAGSAVRYGSRLPGMIGFLERGRAALQRVPVAFFTVCMKARESSPSSRQEVAQYAKAARALLKPKSEAFFAGKIDLATLSFFERLAVRIAKLPIADLRDWPVIRGWADGLKASLFIQS